jgi:hypothetical protein
MSAVPQSFGVGGVQALTDAATITLDLGLAPGNVPPGTTQQVGSGNYFSVTLGGNRTLAIYNIIDGQIIYLRVTQDGTGSRTLTPQLGATASTVLTSGTPLTTTASATDLVAVQYDATLGKLLYYPVAKNLA